MPIYVKLDRSVMTAKAIKEHVTHLKDIFGTDGHMVLKGDTSVTAVYATSRVLETAVDMSPDAEYPISVSILRMPYSNACWNTVQLKNMPGITYIALVDSETSPE